MIWIAGALAHTPVLHDVRADMDWCGFVNGLVENNGLRFEPGDVALFQPGTYTGGCDFTALPTTESGEVSILQSADTDQPAVFTHDGSSPWILRVTGQAFFLVGLRFDSVPEGVDAVLLQDAHNGWVRYPQLPRVDGTGVAVRGTCSELDLLNLRIEGGTGRGVDVQCDGDISLGESWLTLDDAVSVEATEAHLFDNTFDGAGPLFLRAETLLERNLVVGATQALDVGGPSLLMRGNIVEADEVGTFEPSTQVRVLGNTLLASFQAPDGAVVQANALRNAVDPGPNVVCDASCFTDQTRRDLYPPAASPLRALDTLPDDIGLDFCKQDRIQPVAGALTDDTQPPGPIPIGFKSDLPCTFADLPRRETPASREDAAVSGGGCATSSPLVLFAWVYIPLFLRTRRTGGSLCS